MKRAKVIQLREVLTKQRRKIAREFARDLRLCARIIEREYSERIGGYCVVIWDRDEKTEVYWDWAESLGQFALPDFVEQSIRRRFSIKDAQRAIIPSQEDDV